jgi:hypothetical protein
MHERGGPRVAKEFSDMFGLRVVCTYAALKDGDIRLFPESRHRSRRIHKKLVKRFGGEFKKVPAIYQAGDTLYAHPAVYHLLKQEIASARRPSSFP